jgi:hypothetical protein
MVESLMRQTQGPSRGRDLGGRKLPSSGPKGRLRFDLREVDRATTSRLNSEGTAG